MKKFTWGLSLVVTASLIGLVGCSDEKAAMKEKELERKIVELQEQLEKANQEKEEALSNLDQKLKEEQEKKEEEQRVIEVKVVDPNSNEVIQTFLPKDMGFGIDNEKYKKDIEAWVKTIARGTDDKAGIDQRMSPDRIDESGQIIKGNPRIILEEAELTEKIMEASINGGTVELPIYVYESGYQPEDAAVLDETVVATYTTHFDSSVEGRTKNIELSAAAIDHVILGKNDAFSFNTTVGPSDAAHGYQRAKEIVDGKLVWGIGGGICQTSSTLFNAIDQLGVEYIEWHHHSLSVGYVPEGRDATVSYGGLDFRFENTTGVPLLINAIMKDGSLTVEIKTSNEYAKLIKR
jgi:vancomycin resistance protein YoaR